MAQVAILKAHSKAMRRGCDPRGATCRSKLQSKRAKLNQEINKELRLRTGAENLLKATSNKKLRETISLELSFVNSNLQLLKEQLADLNSCVEIYQLESNSQGESHIPMIPLGLKETKDIALHQVLADFIEERYKESVADFEEAIAEVNDIRQAMRTPSRDGLGISLLHEYYNQLYYLEKRFYSHDKNLGIFFEWYDSLTGIPSCQRTVAFEKACVLFNLGALYTQIGARQPRRTPRGLDAAVDNFLRAASVFRYIGDNFTNAPSMDLAPEVLDALILLMMAQARECLFEKLKMNNSLDLNSVPEESKENQHKVSIPIDTLLEEAQEAAELSESYAQVDESLNKELVKNYIPSSWIAFVQVKREFYRAAAHGLAGRGLCLHRGPFSSRTREIIDCLYADDPDPKKTTVVDVRIPKDEDERLQLAKAHLHEAVAGFEESLRIQRMCRELRKRSGLQSILEKARDEAEGFLAQVKERDEGFDEILDPPAIVGSTKFQLSFEEPNFRQHKVEDIFRKLGPLCLFSAKQKWISIRQTHLRKLPDQGFGFSVRGDGPVLIAGVDGASIADLAGVREGDVIIGIGDLDVKWASHEEVVNLIRAAKDNLRLRLATPAEKPAQPKPANKMLAKALPSTGKNSSSSPMSTTSSSSGVSSAASNFSSIFSSRSSSAASKLDKYRLDPTSSKIDVKYRSESKKNRGNPTGRLSLAADFFSPARNREEKRSRFTWNPFRKTERSKDRNKISKSYFGDAFYKPAGFATLKPFKYSKPLIF